MMKNKLATLLLESNLKLVTAESCTGGGIAHALTEITGSSNWFERGFVTYSNAAKQQCLGVLDKTLQQFGAVSEKTAGEMALGAIQHSAADVSISVTGIAGPGGGSADKPVGLVWFGFAHRNSLLAVDSKQWDGDRYTVREQSVQFAITRLWQLLMVASV